MEFGTLRLAVRFFRDERLRAPVLVVSMAVLGYSLHAPVISFFFLQLHLTPVQIGMLGAISSVGTMLLSPLYGWLLDTHGAYHAILFSSSMCALGCLVRGCATSATSLVLASVLLGLGGGNLITLVCAHLSSRTPRAERAPLLSAYLSLLSILNIGGKALYVPFDALLYNLGVSNLMLRYRITMSVCTFFCFFGVIKLWHSGRLLRARGAFAPPLATSQLQECRAPSQECTILRMNAASMPENAGTRRAHRVSRPSPTRRAALAKPAFSRWCFFPSG